MNVVSKVVSCLFGGIFALVASTVSHADTTRGTSELSLYGNIFSGSGFTFATANIDYGYYFTDQVRGIFGASAFGSTGGDDSIVFGARSGLVYDFRPQGNTAYIGGVVNVFDVSEASDTAAGYVYLGYRQWLGENAALFYQAGYSYTFRSPGGLNGDFDADFDVGGLTGGNRGIALAEFGLTIFFN